MDFGLNQGFVIRFEITDDKVRCVIFKASDELACRTEKRTKIRDFIDSDEQIIFKGRIQFRRNKDVFDVLYKQELIGVIEKKMFLAAISG